MAQRARPSPAVPALVHQLAPAPTHTPVGCGLVASGARHASRLLWKAVRIWPANAVRCCSTLLLPRPPLPLPQEPAAQVSRFPRHAGGAGSGAVGGWPGGGGGGGVAARGRPAVPRPRLAARRAALAAAAGRGAAGADRDTRRGGGGRRHHMRIWGCAERRQLLSRAAPRHERSLPLEPGLGLAPVSVPAGGAASLLA